MSINDVHALSISGRYLGVPVAITMAYRQDEDDDPVVSPGRDLINGWFNEAGGPWLSIRGNISDQLIWECATDTWADQSETVFLSGGSGTAVGPSMPSPHAIQMNIPAFSPHRTGPGPHFNEGRFFLPGIMIEFTQRSGYTGAFNSSLVVFAASLLEVDGIGGPPPRFVLMPHARYRDPVGGVANAEAGLPSNHPFIKIIGNRRADQCTTFTGGSGAGFDPIVIPPPVP